MYYFSFGYPANHVFLTDAAGKKTENGLKIQCIFNADPSRSIAINGVPATPASGCLKATVELTSFKNILTAVDTQTGEKNSITVYYVKKAHKTYRFSLDDNIWFLQDIAKNQHIYRSIFENPYLSMLKGVHDQYGTHFHLNIYYETPHDGGFNLTMMPDKYKSEFIAHSDWLRFSFHANADKPDRPFIRKGYDQTKFECLRVAEHIIRFAGEESYAKEVTTMHWGDATKESVRALRACGVRMLVGSFRYANPNNVQIRYYLNAEQCALMENYGFYYDPETDMEFVRYGSTLQHTALEDVPVLSALFEKQYPLYSHKEICVHEQYFYPHYVRYMPDYPQRFDIGVKWAVENGYRSLFLSDIMEFDQKR
ncbi:MAG TPA: hypothetical protein DCY75_07355 [Clostridiales bacterium]|nr:hypothetical protein [Clostridiales bacterium]